MRVSLRFGILLLLMAFLVVGPVSAKIQQNPILIPDIESVFIEDTTSTVFDASSEDQAIASVFFWGVMPNTHVDFTLYHGGGSSTGSVDYHHLPPGMWPAGWGHNKTFSLAGKSSSYESWMPTYGAGFCNFYGKDPETEETYLSIGDTPPFAEDQRLWVSVPGLLYGPVYKVEVQSSSPIKVEIRYGGSRAISDCLAVYGSDTEATDYLGTLLDFVGTIWDLVYGVILLFKILLIDRWLQVLVVFESVAIGHSCYHARDFIGFIRNFTRVNEKAITLVAGIIAWIMEFFFKLIQAIKPL